MPQETLPDHLPILPALALENIPRQISLPVRDSLLRIGGNEMIPQAHVLIRLIINNYKRDTAALFLKIGQDSCFPPFMQGPAVRFPNLTCNMTSQNSVVESPGISQ